MGFRTRAKPYLALLVPTLRAGGAERVMIQVANWCTAAGARVDFLVACADRAPRESVPATVRVVDLNARHVSGSVPKLVRYLRAAEPDALLSTLTHANIAALTASAVSRARTIIVVREATSVSHAAAADRSLRGRLLPLLARWTYRRAHAVIAVSHGVGSDLTALGVPAERIRVIHNPVPVTQIRALANEPVTHPWFAPGEPPVVVSVGRLTKQKDHETLLRAFAIARHIHPMRLLILGEGEERVALERLTAQLDLTDVVALPGFAANPFPFMARAALLVLSSAWEGLPNVLIQALVVGCPVVSTDCPSGPREILAGGRFGRLVPVGDPRRLGETIVEALQSSPPQHLLQSRGDEFDTDRIAPQYWELLTGHASATPLAVRAQSGGS